MELGIFVFTTIRRNDIKVDPRTLLVPLPVSKACLKGYTKMRRDAGTDDRTVYAGQPAVHLICTDCCFQSVITGIKSITGVYS